MFLCPQCCLKENVSEFEMLFGSRSYGSCEGCGKTASCVDHHFRPTPRALDSETGAEKSDGESKPAVSGQ